MTAADKITAAINLLTDAADDMIIDRDRLWAAADAAKAAGADWTDDNAAGNTCDAADAALRGLVTYATARTGHIR